MSLEINSSYGRRLERYYDSKSHNLSLKVTSYIKENCQNVSHSNVLEFLNKFNEFLEYYKNDRLDTIPHEKRGEYFVSFMWGLMAIAIEKNEGFTEGTFIFKDPQQKILNFFKPIAYCRYSSHFKKRILDEHTHFLHNSFAIDDLRFPSNHRTGVFASIETLTGEDYTYVKPESYAANLMAPIDYILHAGSYLLSRPRVWGLPLFRDLTKEANYREEDTPRPLLEKFQEVMQSEDLDSLMGEANTLVHHHGIAGIHKASKKIVHLSTIHEGEFPGLSSAKEKAERLIEELEQSFSDCHLRKGREVVIDELDIN